MWDFLCGVVRERCRRNPPLNGESTEPGITSLGAEVDSLGPAHRKVVFTAAFLLQRLHIRRPKDQRMIDDLFRR
jgi:hypothetical protein